MTNKDFYKSIFFQIESSQEAYKNYMKTRNFFNAKVLYSINQYLLTYINAHSYLIKEDHKSIFQELIIHFWGWMNQFDFEAKKRKPELDNEFVFERAEGVLPYPSNFMKMLKRNV